MLEDCRDYIDKLCRENAAMSENARRRDEEAVSAVVSIINAQSDPFIVQSKNARFWLQQLLDMYVQLEGEARVCASLTLLCL